MPVSRRAFTLIELLVVITIIVILLALLTPAMDKAIYQAELAVCQTRQRSVVNGVVLYAASNKRNYPYRPEFYPPYSTYATEPKSLRRGAIRFSDVFKDYMDVGSVMLDPLSARVDLNNADPNLYTYAGYELFFGWQYQVGGQKQKGMFKIGDRFAYSAPSSLGVVTQRFNVLMTDLSFAAAGITAAGTSHPDYENRMFNYVRNPENSTVDSFWWITTGPTAGSDRSPIDWQFARDDGSVERYEQLEEFNPSRPASLNDPRVVQIPVIADGSYADWVMDVPAR